jgi:hypothetical protein
MEFKELLEKIRVRPALYLGDSKITSLYHFLDGYFINNSAPEFDGFNDFVSSYFGKYGTAGWKNHILAWCNGDEEQGLKLFFELYDEYLKNPDKPNSRAIVHRLLYLALIDFRAESDFKRQSQIADLLHNVPLKLVSAAYSGIDWEYEMILQEIFEKTYQNSYLQHWIEANIKEIGYFKYEIWENETAKTLIRTDNQQRDLLIESDAKLIKTFLAINPEKALEIKEEIFKL